MVWQPQHKPLGEVCTRCGVASSRHKVDKRGYRSKYQSNYRRDTPKKLVRDRIIGIDGEGQGRDPHLYTFLAAADESGLTWEVGKADRKRLTTVECLDFILSLPDRALIFAYAFVYDLTKILTDVDDKTLYLLFHEKRRAKVIDGRIVYRAVKWRGYKLDYMNRRFSVRRGNAHATIWDIFRFFATKFTQALIDWQVAAKDKLERMEEMKEKRAEFNKLQPGDIREYCKEECRYVAKLGRGLLDAHDEADLPLRTYYGAGSTASVFLDRIGIKEKRGEAPSAMRVPVACAFFGGRFENSFFGHVEGTVWNYDISSAYPYQATFLPCLQHGSWTHVKRLDARFDRSQLALIRWTIAAIVPSQWGVLPVRNEKGEICFPLAGEGGWTWKQEFLAAQRLNPKVEAKEAWLYETTCDCQPFKDIPTYYRERVKLGKEGKGIVLKLGTNSVYGKLAQSKGLNPPYQSWIWAGNITSGTRAQLLDSLHAHGRALGDCLMHATDGVWSRQRLSLPAPQGTGTDDVAKPDGTRVPLGGWEEKRFDSGVFCVRPGIYFPLNPTESQLKEVRARGLGKKVLYEQWQRIVDAWEAGDKEVRIGEMSRFVGIKSAVTWSLSQGVKRSPTYGEWIPHAVKVSFKPTPKRSHVNPDGTLEPFHYIEQESVPYDNAMRSEEATLLQAAEQIAEEQPNGEFADLD